MFAVWADHSHKVVGGGGGDVVARRNSCRAPIDGLAGAGRVQ